jgi:Asp-tRNA(Asn)/Glu-tRNA(Gln) amidotransferase A subunit family amidase
LQSVIGNARAAPDADAVGALAALERRADALRAEADRFLDDHELLIAPVATCEIPPAGGAAVPLQALGPCQAITLLELPSVSIAGVQLIGPRGRDEDVLGAALAFESLDR